MIKHNIKYRGIGKINYIAIENTVTAEHNSKLKKPKWIKKNIPSDFSLIQKIKLIMRKNNLHSVCEEASCPNLPECFNRGTATFMILGDICTRRCPFCNVTYGRPTALDINEPSRLARAISNMDLRYVVITSVNRDDLRDGGAQHFANCITAIREKNKNITIEILVPDFRGCMDLALGIFNISPPDIFNHNLESVPRLYRQIRPGANYNWSLKLLKNFKEAHPNIPTKSGLIVGLGETKDEIIKVMHDLLCNGVTMITIGQYLQPSRHHLPVHHYLSLDEFQDIKNKAKSMGFTNVACGPFVRSSYFADKQERGEEIK